MKIWLRRGFVLALFALLALVLLWFQGIILRKEHPAAEVPRAPELGASERSFQAELRALPRLEVHPGFVEAVEAAEIAPRVMAAILELNGHEGDAVAAGQLLVRLDDRDARAQNAQAEAALSAARAASQQAALAFDRAERLLAAEALTTQEWEAARAARDGARAQEQRALQAVEQAAAALSWFELRAPFAGRILSRQADPGQMAAPGRPLLTLYRGDRLRFAVAVPEERAAGLTPGAEYELDFDPLPARSAALTRVLPSADRATGTVELQLALADSADLRPGLLGRLALTTGQREALVVPAAAIERIGQIERVQLVRAGRVEPVTVRTGKRHGELIEILSGLAAGEVVRLP